VHSGKLRSSSKSTIESEFILQLAKLGREPTCLYPSTASGGNCKGLVLEITDSRLKSSLL